MRLAAALLVALALSAPAHASGRGPCTAERLEVRHSMGVGERHHRMDSLIRCASSRFSTRYVTAERVADCESSDFPWAHSNGNFGTFQIRDWKSRARYWLRGRHWMFPRWLHHGRVPRWQEERANTFVAVIWAHRRGWAAWSCS